MKFAKYILCGAVVSLGLVSCVKETRLQNEATGHLKLNVSAIEPNATRAAATDDFEVVIKDESNQVVKEYAKVTEVPQSIEVPMGKYTVEAHTPGQLAVEMDHAYYSGSFVATVTPSVATNADVKCKMLNSCININTDGLAGIYKSWTVTIDDGNGAAISFVSTSDVTTKYYAFTDGEAKKLTLKFEGIIQKEGDLLPTKVSPAPYTLSKETANNKYDDDAEHFNGGETLMIDLKPSEATEGDLTGVTINVNIDFSYNDHDNDVIINVVQKEDEPIVDPVPPVVEDDVVKITIPEPITYAQEDGFDIDPTIGNVVVEASAGIKSLKIRIASDNNDFIGALQDVAAQYEGMDLVNGCEVVDNQNLVEFLGSLQQELSVPTAGDKECTFPMGNFFGFLATFASEYQFHFELTDLKGNKTSAIVKITVTE